MRFYRASEFTHSNAWGSEILQNFTRSTARLHWTDTAYRWHSNTGPELFAVLDGTVDMHFRDDGEELVQELVAGDLAVIGHGEEHFAAPRGEARILVLERPDSD